MRAALALVGVCFLTSVAFAAPASAQLSVIASHVGPIVDGGACSAERRDAGLYNNAGWDPGALAAAGGNFGGPGTVPALEDVQPAPIAGARTDYCVAYALTPDMNDGNRTGYTATPAELAATDVINGDDQRRVSVDMPIGFAGAVAGRATCNPGAGGFGFDDWTSANCPLDTQVGDGQIRFSLAQGAFYNGTIIGGAGQAIYNLPPGPDEVARLGISVDPGLTSPAKFLVRVKFAEGDPTRLRTIVDPAPRQVKAKFNPSMFDLYVETVALRLWGQGGAGTAHPTMPGAFVENGTRCGTPLQATIDGATYGGVPFGVTTAPYQLTGCDDLAFDPSINVTTTVRAPATPTGVRVELDLAQSAGNARGTALLKDAAVTLPAGLELGAQVGARAEGVGLCSPAQFGRGSASPAGCPAASRVGTVRIDSPLIADPLQGEVFLGPQPAVGELPDLYLQASLRGEAAVDTPRIKLVGTTTVSADGQITSSFADNPELRFAKLALEFDGGPNALFVTPRACGTTDSVSRFTSWAGGPEVTRRSALTIDQGCDLPGFAPSVAVVPANATAGVKAPVSVVVSRPDRSSWLKDVHVSLPSGQLADLKGLPECPRWAADAGNCPENTRIGSVTSVAGAGPNPLSLSGGLYIVEREAGTVAGAVIVVRAKIGEIDLGDVVVPGRINLRPTDAGLDFITTAPDRFRGLALNLQSITVALDRPDFALNPSACGPLGYSAQLTGSGGESVGAGGSVSYYGCGDRPFAPRLDARLTGEIEPGGHPGMKVTVATRPGDSTMRRAEVLLPEGVAADLKNVQISCARPDFDAVRCPANTRVGTVAARVSITDEVIPGDVFLVKVPGETLPGLGLNFTGRFAQRLMSVVKISATGRLITRFDTIPDLPLTAFTIDVKSAADGPLQLPPGECAANTRWDGTFGAWGGQTATSQIGLRCAATAKVKLTKGTGLSTRLFDFGGRHLRTLKVTLPSGVTFDTKRAKSKKYQWARLAGSKAKLRFTKRSITITATDRDATNVRLKIKSGALKFSKRAARKKSQTLKLRMVFQGTQEVLSFTPGEKNPILIDGAVQTQTVTYKKPSKKSKSKKSKSKKSSR